MEKCLFRIYETIRKIPSFFSFFIYIKFVEYYFIISKLSVLIVIDHYSSIYDKYNEIKELKDLCITQKKFIIYIFYEVNNIEDKKLFIEYWKKPESVIHEIPCKGENKNNQVDLSLIEVACFFGYELRNHQDIIDKIEKTKIKEIKKLGCVPENTNEIIKFMKNIPKNYVKYFGNNISYYFKYLTMSNIKFGDFIKSEKIEIRKNIITFLESNNSVSSKSSYKILNDILNNVYKELDANYYLLNFINSSYFFFIELNPIIVLNINTHFLFL